jgi:hypothetical protein
MEQRNKVMNKDEPSFRYERKFIISDPLINSFELINKNKLHINEIYNERNVNSIYFDTNSLKLAKQNQNGLSSRFKVRIRFYGDLNNIYSPNLEIKIRNGNKGRKILYKLDKKRLSDNNFDLKNILKDDQINELKNEIEFYSLKPKILISYKRKYYSTLSNDLRITFDRFIQFKKLNQNNPFQSFNDGFISFQKKILEFKYKDLSKSSVSLLIKNNPYRLTSCSKYLIGLQNLGLLNVI